MENGFDRKYGYTMAYRGKVGGNAETSGCNLREALSSTHDKGEGKEFGVWYEFETHDWKVPLVTQTATIKWDFLIKLDFVHLGVMN
jgi:hypothetical protein